MGFTEALGKSMSFCDMFATMTYALGNKRKKREGEFNGRIEAILTSYNNDIKLEKQFAELPPIKAKPEGRFLLTC